MDERNIREVIGRFSIYGDLLSVKAFGGGHINSTFVSTFNQAGTPVRYTHQRINRDVFADPEGVVENISLVTEHLRKKEIAAGVADASSRVLSLVPARDGSLFVRDGEGEVWRTYLFIERVRTFSVLENPVLAQKVGAAVAVFQQGLSDYSGPRLKDTIPRFHDMGSRYSQLDAAISENRAGRLEKITPEISFLMENRSRGMVLTDGLTSGVLREGITHNDTKLNNILFGDAGTFAGDAEAEAQCVIDLDTVMPGTILFDTGDLIRTATITGEEDERDLSRIRFDFDLFSALMGGYLSVARSFLTTAELSLLAESGRTITQIMAVRFLTDYLNGDVYYRTTRDDHNLDRARTQIALIKSMDRQWDRLSDYVSGVVSVDG